MQDTRADEAWATKLRRSFRLRANPLPILSGKVRERRKRVWLDANPATGFCALRSPLYPVPESGFATGNFCARRT